MIRLKTILQLIIFLSSVSAFGCGFTQPSANKPSGNQSSVSIAPPDNSAVAQPSAGVTCADMIGKMEDDVVGGKGKIPADFPEPPPGSTLCGYAGLGHGVFYLNTTMSDDDIIKYYEDALRKQGYEVDPPRSPAGEDKQLSFTRPNAVSGYVGTNGERDSMSRKFKDFFSIGYEPIVK